MNVLFFPYGVLIPHRHFWSHFPIVGTVGRLAWLLFVAAEIAIVTEYEEVLLQWLASVAEDLFYRQVAMCFVLGLMFVDLLHWVCDGRPAKKGI